MCMHADVIRVKAKFLRPETKLCKWALVLMHPRIVVIDLIDLHSESTFNFVCKERFGAIECIALENPFKN